MDNETEYNHAYAAMVGRHEKIIFSVCFFYASADVSFDDLRQEMLILFSKDIDISGETHPSPLGSIRSH